MRVGAVSTLDLSSVRMLRFPLKKIRKQFKLLLLLVLLTFAVWFTYLHINQGKAIKLHFNYGKGRQCALCVVFSLCNACGPANQLIKGELHPFLTICRT